MADRAIPGVPAARCLRQLRASARFGPLGASCPVGYIQGCRVVPVSVPLPHHSMIRQDLLDILRCPIDGQSLRLADPSLIDEINKAIQNDQLTNRSGQQIEVLLDQGLVREDGKLLYPVVEDIPKLLAEECISLESFSSP